MIRLLEHTYSCAIKMGKVDQWLHQYLPIQNCFLFSEAELQLVLKLLLKNYMLQIIVFRL